jgi:hypothetical protein
MIIGAVKGIMEIGGKTWDFMIGEKGAVTVQGDDTYDIVSNDKITAAQTKASEVAKASKGADESDEDADATIEFNKNSDKPLVTKYVFTRHARTIIGPLATVFTMPVEVWVERGKMQVGVGGMNQGEPVPYIHSIWIGKSAGNTKAQMIAKGDIKFSIDPNSDFLGDYTITIESSLATRGKTTFDPDDATDTITVSPTSESLVLNGTHLAPV